MVEATQVFQSGLVAELVLVLRGRNPTTAPLNPPSCSDICSPNQLSLYLRLHHGRSLRAQHFDSLEDIHGSFVAHPLQDDTQGDEDSRPPHTGTTAAREQTRIRLRPCSIMLQMYFLPATHLQ